MRTLTIKREKHFAGCLGKMKVYVEDQNNSELTICGVPCKKLGDLKNGAEESFQIPSSEVKVFVIADKASKEYCNDFYQLPAGNSDVRLTGRNKFNPLTGNAFRFNNNNDQAAIQNRTKALGRGIGVMLIAVVIGFVLGFVLVSNML